ncbi:ATP-binding cassette domain-containing protein [Treponema sp.]|uniref:ATP-binding cassette domain-containing protein n=1 Tax=Treponema sp. TaxID=166 RepID=UPI00388F4EBA
MALFDVENVAFNSRTSQIIKGISLTIEKGSVTALTGKSGCGKSTLLKLIAGILVPSSGRVLFNGNDIQTMNNARNMNFRRRCAFVFQDSALLANQNILQNLNLPLQTHHPELSEKKRIEQIQEVCEIVKYDRSLNLRPTDLSMGEQKKIAFARALINKPEVLFLDECTESLDRKGVAVIMELLQKFISDGNTVIYVSHNSYFITALSGHIYVIEEGLLTE